MLEGKIEKIECIVKHLYDYMRILRLKLIFIILARKMFVEVLSGKLLQSG